MKRIIAWGQQGLRLSALRLSPDKPAIQYSHSYLTYARHPLGTRSVDGLSELLPRTWLQAQGHTLREACWLAILQANKTAVIGAPPGIDRATITARLVSHEAHAVSAHARVVAALTEAVTALAHIRAAAHILTIVGDEVPISFQTTSPPAHVHLIPVTSIVVHLLDKIILGAAATCFEAGTLPKGSVPLKGVLQGHEVLSLVWFTE